MLQSNGDMKTPMVAQILGAVTNIIIDPLLIFGMFGLPEFGIAGAAVATVAWQIVAALVVMKRGYKKVSRERAVPAPYRGNFPSWYAEYSDAVGIHLLHIGAQSHSCRFLRSGCDRVRALL